MADTHTRDFPLARADTIPLDEIDVSHAELWRSDSHWPYFARLRREAPAHYCPQTLRANKSETIDWLMFTLEGAGARTDGHALTDAAFAGCRVRRHFA